LVFGLLGDEPCHQAGLHLFLELNDFAPTFAGAINTSA
jgi:hypothetical protein